MMKKIITLITLLSTSTICLAQVEFNFDKTSKKSNNTQGYELLEDQRGYESSVEFSAFVELNNQQHQEIKYRNETIKYQAILSSFNLNYVGSYRFNQFIALGLGTGLDYSVSLPIIEHTNDFKELQQHYLLIPAFIRAKANILDIDYSPYISLDLGYNFLVYSECYGETLSDITDIKNSYVYKNSGLIVSPSIGCDFELGGSAIIFAAISYMYNYIPVHSEEFTSHRHFLGVKIGCSF